MKAVCWQKKECTCQRKHLPKFAAAHNNYQTEYILSVCMYFLTLQVCVLPVSLDEAFVGDDIKQQRPGTTVSDCDSECVNDTSANQTALERPKEKNQKRIQKGYPEKCSFLLFWQICGSCANT